MPANKIVIHTDKGEEVLIDLTNDTVTPDKLAKGVTAHDASGNLIIGTLEISTYKNVLPSAEMGTDQATSWVEGKGYSIQARLSGSEGKVYAPYTNVAGIAVTGYIKCGVGDTIRIKNFYAPQGVSCYVVSYNSSKSRIKHQAFTPRNSDTLAWVDGSFYTVEGEKTLNGITTITLTEANFGTGVEYIRFSGIITEDTIVTVNKEIT